jgi:hypothetical protein
MANRVAQQAADAAEQNAYRNYLNAVANTNIRRSEGEALDRYRQGELGIRGQDVMGMNEYRRGQIGIGETDVRNRGTYQNEIARIAGLEAMNRADAIREQGRLQEAMMKTQERMAGLPYEKVPAERQRYFDLLQANPNMMATPEERMMRLSQQQERQKEYGTAVQKAIEDYYQQATGPLGGAFTWNSPMTDMILDELSKNKSKSVPQVAAELVGKQMQAMYGISSPDPQKMTPTPTGIDGTNRLPSSVLDPLVSTNMSGQNPARVDFSGGTNAATINPLGRFWLQNNPAR